MAGELDRFLTDRGGGYYARTTATTPAPAQTRRQLIESVNDTLQGQLDLELHGGRTIDGVTARIAQRVLAFTAASWHNRAAGQPATPITDRLRPLTSSDLLV